VRKLLQLALALAASYSNAVSVSVRMQVLEPTTLDLTLNKAYSLDSKSMLITLSCTKECKEQTIIYQ